MDLLKKLFGAKEATVALAALQGDKTRSQSSLALDPLQRIKRATRPSAEDTERQLPNLAEFGLTYRDGGWEFKGLGTELITELRKPEDCIPLLHLLASEGYRFTRILFGPDGWMILNSSSQALKVFTPFRDLDSGAKMMGEISLKMGKNWQMDEVTYRGGGYHVLTLDL